ncbi:MAG: DUF4118 domain-containing protein [Acidobacteria bacterium]|nr:DUF4118 domain-containing protein [Acidobacteriota bacterium]
MPRVAEVSGRRVLRVCLSVAIVTAISLVEFALNSVNHTTVALTLLLAVLGIATWWGLVESLAASLAGMMCFNFLFLPPVGAWTIADPQNWVALFTFVGVAAVASQLSASAKRRAGEAASRQRDMERLYSLSRCLMLMDPQSPLGRQVAVHTAQVFGFPTVGFFERESDEVHWAGETPNGTEETLLRNEAKQGAAGTEADSMLTVLPVTAGERSLGSLAVPRDLASDTALRSIAHLVAIALERAHAQLAASRAEAARQSEEMKSAMLDALAHEFKTPLTAVKAAVTSVLNDESAAWANKELLQIIDEETDRLTSLVSESVQIARIEAGRMEMRQHPHSVAELIREALAGMAGKLEPRTVEVSASDSLAPVLADRELVLIVLRQLLDNAAKYSPPSSPITIAAREQGDSLRVTVADRGPGIADPEVNRVFEKFYRGREARERIPGTGMGLAIAREIVRGHGGDIRVESRPGQGCEFTFFLPLAQETHS